MHWIGAPLIVVGRALGQSDTRMVDQHYGRPAPSDIADTIRSTAPNLTLEAVGVASTTACIMSVEKSEQLQPMRR